ncbi:AmiS/UreI family transporter [Peribacillus kribbensis]|uniref:AmiS/UreI family transporter n=1 Tax=Peribacillus kribbensis TaxID=356658 RepID=UPI00040EDAEB|nr:AmiS/UreI family transporter [Peribacillus kribbensis]
MLSVGLLLSGAALFLNALMLLGKAEEKSAGVFNLFVGVFQVAAPFYTIMISDQSSWSVFQNGAVFLFGLTYLYVGVTVLKGMNGTGLGYFSLWVSIICLVYTGASVVHFHDYLNAVTWLSWAILWFLFFLLNALNKKAEAYVGKVAMIQSWTTLTIPALMTMMDGWGGKIITSVWTAVLIVSILYFILSGYKMLHSNEPSLESASPEI